jgi:hypothetical protein
MIVMAASANDKRLARYHWGLAMTALETAMNEYDH